jgi:uncharacterized protein (TIGR03086 family)
MSEIADRYGRIADGFTARLAAVPPGAWSSPSPCSDWTARDVVAHLIEVTRGMVTRLTGGDPSPPDTDEDLVAAWKVESEAVRTGLASDRSRTDVKGLGGQQPWEELIGTVLCADTLLHTWDLARATGQDDRLDPAGVEAAHAFLTPNDEMLRGPGAFADKIEPPADADAQTRLLCFAGRRP